MYIMIINILTCKYRYIGIVEIRLVLNTAQLELSLLTLIDYVNILRPIIDGLIRNHFSTENSQSPSAAWEIIDLLELGEPNT